MMSKKELEKMIEKKQVVSDRNFQNYQETGEQRYYRAYSNAEELLDILRVALYSADEHQKLISIRSELSTIRERCERALADRPELAESILHDLIAICKIHNI